MNNVQEILAHWPVIFSGFGDNSLIAGSPNRTENRFLFHDEEGIFYIAEGYSPPETAVSDPTEPSAGISGGESGTRDPSVLPDIVRGARGVVRQTFLADKTVYRSGKDPPGNPW